MIAEVRELKSGLLICIAILISPCEVFSQPLEKGQAVVTCFSGFETPNDSRTPLKDDYVLGIVDVRDTSDVKARKGVHWPAPMFHHDSWKSGSAGTPKMGQVFGVAIDSNANIYVAATTLYGEHPFGTAGAGGVYRINANTWKVANFVTTVNSPDSNTIGTKELPNTGSALGNICYDQEHNQLFVSNFEDGKLYRIDMDGTVLGVHDPKNADDGTAGFAPLGERIWGVAVFESRVYYAVWVKDRGRRGTLAESNEIRSIGLSAGGSFEEADRLEITLPLYERDGRNYSNPVSDIAFSGAGAILLAEHTMAADAGDISIKESFAHRSRLLEYIKESGSWELAPPGTKKFQIGGHGHKTNCAGGTDYGFGSFNGILRTVSDRDSMVWCTGDAMHPQHGRGDEHWVYGLQGTAASGGRAATSYLIDLDGDLTSARTTQKLQIGDLDIFKSDEKCALRLTGSNPVICAGEDIRLRIGVSGGDGDYSYRWIPPLDLDDPLTADPLSTATSTERYTVHVTDGEGCVAVSSLTLTVFSGITVAPGAEREICPGEFTRLGGEPTGGGGTGELRYEWQPHTGLDNPFSANPRAMPASSATYTVTVSDAIGCSSSAEVRVTVHPRLRAEAGEDRTLCHREAVRLGGAPTGAGGAGPLHYQWQPAELVDDAGSPNPEVKLVSSATLTVTVTDAEGCSSRATLNLRVRPALKADAGSNQRLCEGETVTVGGAPTGEGGSGNLKYSWEPAGGLDDPSLANPTFIGSSSATYTVTVRDEADCFSSASVTVNVHPFLRADAGVDREVCSGEAIGLGGSPTGSGGAGQLTFAWQPTAWLENPFTMHPTLRISTNATLRTVYAVTVTDLFGCTTTDSVSIIVHPLPRLSAVQDTIRICPNESAELRLVASEQNTGRLRYSWTPPLGLSDTRAATPVVELSTPGVYSYRATVTDSLGCAASTSISVIVRPVPRVSIEPPSLDFGVLPECESSMLRTLRIRNDGEEALTITDVDNNSGFSFAEPLPITIDRGDDVSVRIRFAPPQTGDFSEWMYFRLAPCGGLDSVLLRGSATSIAAELSVTEIDFGQFLLCDRQVERRAVEIVNSGTADLLPEAISVSRPFTIEEWSSDTLAVGERRRFYVDIESEAAGNFTDVLRIPFRTGECFDTLHILLRAEVIEPLLTVQSAAIDFGALLSCESRDTIIAIHNPGPLTITLREITPSPPLSTTPPLPLEIPGGESVNVALRFTPFEEGAFDRVAGLHYTPCDKTLGLRVMAQPAEIGIALPDTLDLGELVFCREQSVQTTFTIAHGSETDLGFRVEEVLVDGPFSTSLTSGERFKRGDRKEFTVWFRADDTMADGKYSGWIDITFDGCDTKHRIVLEGIKHSIFDKFRDTGLAFGLQAPTAAVVREYTFINRASIAVEVSGLEAPQAPFRILSVIPALPRRLEPGATLQIRVLFQADSGQHSSTIQVMSSAPCAGLLTTIRLSGSIADAMGFARICVGSTRVNSGDELSLPLTLKQADGLRQSGATRYEAHLRFNRTLLAPRGDTPSGYTEDDDRIISVSGETPESSGLLQYVDFTAVWGNDSCTAVVIDTVIWYGGTVTTEVEHGMVCLDDICRSGEAHRFYRDAGRTLALRVNGSQPIRDEMTVTYNTIEDGPVHLSVVSLLGHSQVVLANAQQNAGEHEVHFPISHLSSGTFIIVLQTATQHVARLIRVMR